MGTWSGRYVKSGEPPVWKTTEAANEKAALLAFPRGPDGWTLDGVATGDQTQGAVTEFPGESKGKGKGKPAKRRGR